ncbi:hypothetical protein K0U00_16980 [Paenibacillus sepulcri]|uniref:histidine kinase n=3 Tax=Paenibacillus sepulcri TaxID=359917 RepID=A0ABS7C479_9BACL|nr:hypothetical protein [Paenibacillus sepulcri]
MQRLNMRQSSERDERSSKREQAATLHTQEMRELLDSLHEETQRIENALEMMLHTARLEKFELDLTSQRVDLMQLAREVVNEHKKVWIRSSIFPKIITDGSSMVVKTDEKWLRFVLNQLLSNAIKYTRANQGRGARKLLITLEKEGHGCRLCIADEGIGIPEQDLPRVFDPFFTGENGRLVAEATGMGLYLIQQVCARLGHRITVESRQGEGTAVTIRFDNHSLIHDSMHREM